jgi:ankyrin repeat protein
MLLGVLVTTVARADLSLVNAVRQGDADAARRLLSGGVPVNAQEGDGTSALHVAAYRDDAETVKLLLDAGADAALATTFGVTPLALAAENRNAAVTRQLLDRGADANQQESGETPLHVAARTNAADVARVLLSRGANVDARNRWQAVTPLMEAAGAGHAPMVQLLLDAGADVDAKAAVSSLFIGPGDESTTYAQIPRGGMTALSFAARDGCAACIGPLVAAGADVNYADPARVTPLNLAVYNGRFEAADALLDSGADPNDGSLYLAVDFRNLVADGVNADHHPVPRDFDSAASIRTINKLLAAGARPDDELLKELQSRYLGFTRPRYLSGLTPLQRAAEQADIEAMRVLLDGRANPSLANRMKFMSLGGGNAGGETPLIVAIKSVAGVQGSIIGNRPGKLAYRPRTPGDSLAAARLLVDRGADIEGRDWNGNSPVHVAATFGAHEILQLLAERGADLSAKNDGGQTALDIVSRQAATKAALAGRSPPPLFPNPNSHPEETVALLERLLGVAAERE